LSAGSGNEDGADAGNVASAGSSSARLSTGTVIIAAVAAVAAVVVVVAVVAVMRRGSSSRLAPETPMTLQAAVARSQPTRSLVSLDAGVRVTRKEPTAHRLVASESSGWSEDV
jgi:hypothetical protein